MLRECVFLPVLIAQYYERRNLLAHLSMSRMLVYFFLIVSPSINFKFVLWISFSRNLKGVACLNKTGQDFDFNPPQPLAFSALLKQLLPPLHFVAARNNLNKAQTWHRSCQICSRPFHTASSELQSGRSSGPFHILACSTSS